VTGASRADYAGPVGRRQTPLAPTVTVRRMSHFGPTVEKPHWRVTDLDGDRFANQSPQDPGGIRVQFHTASRVDAAADLPPQLQRWSRADLPQRRCLGPLQPLERPFARGPLPPDGGHGPQLGAPMGVELAPGCQAAASDGLMLDLVLHPS
jgi:hypothetical protein